MEEPPPHVVFIMATTELHKIPDTILSRSQVYEFRTIATTRDRRASCAPSRTPKRIDVGDDALALIARYAEGSMRDAQSAFDQVIAFAGTTVTSTTSPRCSAWSAATCCSTSSTAVADEDAAAAFTLAGRAVEAGYDLRILCRELAALVRAMMLVSIDPARAGRSRDGARGRPRAPQALTARFSREDLLRSFDLLAQGGAGRPRRVAAALCARDGAGEVDPPAQAGADRGPDCWTGVRCGGCAGCDRRAACGRCAAGASRAQRACARRAPALDFRIAPVPRHCRSAGRVGGSASVRTPTHHACTRQHPRTRRHPAHPTHFKDRFLAELQRTNRTFYSLHVAQAQKIDVEGDRIVFTFGPVHETMRQQVEQRRGWLESWQNPWQDGRSP